MHQVSFAMTLEQRFNIEHGEKLVNCECIKCDYNNLQDASVSRTQI